MRNKVLIVDREKEVWDELLREVVEAGGELLLATDEKTGLELLKAEHPQLAFVNASLVQERAQWEGIPVVWLSSHPVEGHFLLRPLKHREVVAKCRELLPPAPIPAAPIPPM